MFKTNKLSSSQLYHMMMNLSIKKTDLVIIFSNVMTKKIQTIINKCIDNNIDYLVVKE
jgi:ribosomal protein L7Ae-like RNA K-turn-binding protein